MCGLLNWKNEQMLGSRKNGEAKTGPGIDRSGGGAEIDRPAVEITWFMQPFVVMLNRISDQDHHVFCRHQYEHCCVSQSAGPDYCGG